MQTAPEMQRPPVHLAPFAQSPSDAHAVLHCLVVASHANAPQSIAGGGAQNPWPSQNAAGVRRFPSHAAAPHDVDLPACAAQAVGLMPSHCVTAQTSPASPLLQRARDPCGAPTTGAHVPLVLAPSHASHGPVHAVLQHTLSTQWPVGQSVSAAHATHVPPTQ
jgi:hypothetical protein